MKCTCGTYVLGGGKHAVLCLTWVLYALFLVFWITSYYLTSKDSDNSILGQLD